MTIEKRCQAPEILRLHFLKPYFLCQDLLHELRINDADATWRIIYRIDVDAIIIDELLGVFGAADRACRVVWRSRPAVLTSFVKRSIASA